MAKTSLRTVGLLSILLSLQRPVVAKETKPKYKPLTLQQAVEVLVDYDLNHTAIPPFVVDTPFMEGYSFMKGITDYSAKDITINRMLTDEERALTILHELRHVVFEKEGLPQREDWIKEFACKDYKIIFEIKCPDNGLEESIRLGYR